MKLEGDLLKMKSWTTVDKSTWGEGPWQDEPDKVQWIDEETNLDCLIHRGPTGALCGYVGVDNSHPDYQKEYTNLDVEVHGGLTYSNKCWDTADESSGICHVPEEGRPHDIWWLGFDCGHSGDVSPALEARSRKLNISTSLFSFGETYKELAYVIEEVRNLAKQLKARASENLSYSNNAAAKGT